MSMWSRLARLETMVGQLGNQIEEKDTTAGDESTPENAGVGQATLQTREAPSTYEVVAKQCIGSPIWISLACEVQALRDALEEEYVEGTEEDILQTTSATVAPLGRNSTHDFILCPPGSIYVVSGAETELHEPLRSVMCDLFCENVDRVFKVFHAPTLRAFLISGAPYLGKDRIAPCNAALRAVTYFAATISLTDGQCQALFGRSRPDQVDHFKRMVEVAFTEANLLSTADIATLQAFIVYVVTARLEDKGSRCWSLVAVAVRMARAMGLDHDDFLRSPFEKELRSRLWHQLRLLDMFTAADRSTSPLITSGSFTTSLPLCVNDANFDDQSQVIRDNKPQSITEMSFGRLTYDAIDVAQSLAAPETCPPSPQIWQDRMSLAADFAERARQNIIQFCNPTNPFHQFLHGVARCMVYSMMLRAIRPERPVISAPPPRVDDPKVLNIAVSCLRAASEVQSNPATVNWRWMRWIQWHALAVALAGLCSIKDPEHAGEAWLWVDDALNRYPHDVADAADGMLWALMKRLYQKAKIIHARSESPLPACLSLPAEEPLPQSTESETLNLSRSVHMDAVLLEKMLNDAAIANSSAHWIETALGDGTG